MFLNRRSLLNLGLAYPVAARAVAAPKERVGEGASGGVGETPGNAARQDRRFALSPARPLTT